MKHIDFWKGAIVKAFVMFGFTYFSVSVTLGSWTNPNPSVLAAGLYLFTEAARFYKIQNQVKIKKGHINYNFLI